MLSHLITFAMRQRAAVMLATLILIGIGSWSAIHLPIDAVPDITNPQVQINTAVNALAPEEIEKLVSFPIESEMAGLPQMVELRSLSKFGLSQVTLQFKDGTTAQTLQLDGFETYDVVGLSPEIKPQQDLVLRITRKSGEVRDVPVRCRIDTPIEIDYYQHGGILPYVLRQIVAKN